MDAEIIKSWIGQNLSNYNPQDFEDPNYYTTEKASYDMLVDIKKELFRVNINTKIPHEFEILEYCKDAWSNYYRDGGYINRVPGRKN